MTERHASPQMYAAYEATTTPPIWSAGKRRFSVWHRVENGMDRVAFCQRVFPAGRHIITSTTLPAGDKLCARCARTVHVPLAVA